MIPEHRLCQISWTSLLPELPENGPKSPKKRLFVTEWGLFSSPMLTKAVSWVRNSGSQRVPSVSHEGEYLAGCPPSSSGSTSHNMHFWVSKVSVIESFSPLFIIYYFKTVGVITDRTIKLSFKSQHAKHQSKRREGDASPHRAHISVPARHFISDEQEIQDSRGKRQKKKVHRTLDYLI